MIKIQDNIPKDTKDSLAEVLNCPKLHEALHGIDIELGNFKNPDFVFEMANDLKNPQPNTVAFEKIDGCQIRNKKLLSHPNLVKLVKMYRYTGLGVNNLSCIDGRIFTRFLESDTSKYKEPTIVLEKDFEKVVSGLSFLHFKRHDTIERFLDGLPLDNEREIDVYFGGTTTYGDSNHQSGKLVTEHRLGCIKAIESQMGHLNVVTSETRDPKKDGYSYPEYLQLLHNTKVVVSPWGWGEACYRDYEALLCGCDVIKPSTYAVASVPDIYSPRVEYHPSIVHYCKPDWSNLNAKIEKLLEARAKRLPFMEALSDRILEWRSPIFQAYIIKNIIEDKGEAKEHETTESILSKMLR